MVRTILNDLYSYYHLCASNSVQHYNYIVVVHLIYTRTLFQRLDVQSSSYFLGYQMSQ